MDLNEIINRAEPVITSREEARPVSARIKLQKPKQDFSLQIAAAREEAARKQLRMAEEELIEKYAAEEKMTKEPKVIRPEANEAKIEQKSERKVERVVVKKGKQIEDQLREIEQMIMQREDARSLEVEIFSHKQKFAFKDL